MPHQLVRLLLILIERRGHRPHIQSGTLQWRPNSRIELWVGWHQVQLLLQEVDVNAVQAIERDVCALLLACLVTLDEVLAVGMVDGAHQIPLAHRQFSFYLAGIVGEVVLGDLIESCFHR